MPDPTERREAEPGRPRPDAVEQWLIDRGWVHLPNESNPAFSVYRLPGLRHPRVGRKSRRAKVPMYDEFHDYERYLSELLHDVAEAEGLYRQVRARLLAEIARPALEASDGE